jgi:hypothetical protein
VHAATLPARANDALGGGFQPLVRVGDHQLDAAQAASGQALQEVRPEGLGFRRADAEPNDLAPSFGVGGHSDYRGDRDDASALAHLQVGRIQPQIGQSPSSGRSRKAFTRSSISLHSFETWLFEMPESPIACAISSTRRVDTPPIQASWMTATNAFSVVLRASRNGGK